MHSLREVGLEIGLVGTVTTIVASYIFGYVIEERSSIT
jgi:hypothetical protein